MIPIYEQWMQKRQELKALEILSKYYIANVDEPTEKGETLIVGAKGSGKTSSLEGLTQNFYDCGWKIESTDVFRRENVLYQFPENDPKMLRIIMSAGELPQGYNSNVYIPLYQSTIKKIKVPENWIPYKIFYKDLSLDDFTGFVPASTENVRDMFKAIQRDENTKSFDDFAHTIYQLLSKKSGVKFVMEYQGNKVDVLEPRTVRAVARNISYLYSLNIVSNEKSECLDSAKNMKDQSVIDCFTYFNCDMQLATWLRAVRWSIGMKKRAEGNYPYLFDCNPEAHIWCPNASSFNEYAHNFGSTVGKTMTIFSQGRDLAYKLVFDTQRIRQLHTLIASYFQVYYLMRLPKEDLEYIHKNIVTLPQQYRVMEEIPKYKIGRALKIWDGGAKYRVASIMTPSRSFHKRENMSVFDKFEDEKILFKELHDEFREKVNFVIDRPEGEDVYSGKEILPKKPIEGEKFDYRKFL